MFFCLVVQIHKERAQESVVPPALLKVFLALDEFITAHRSINLNQSGAGELPHTASSLIPHAMQCCIHTPPAHHGRRVCACSSVMSCVCVCACVRVVGGLYAFVCVCVCGCIYTLIHHGVCGYIYTLAQKKSVCASVHAASDRKCQVQVGGGQSALGHRREQRLGVKLRMVTSHLRRGPT